MRVLVLATTRLSKALHVNYCLTGKRRRLESSEVMGSEKYMDSSLFARDFVSDIRRVCIFGFSMETLSPSPQCMRTSVPQRVDGLKGLKTDEALRHLGRHLGRAMASR